MQPTELMRDWRKYGIFSFGSDAFTPLTELYSKCLGLQGQGVAFQFEGTDGKSPKHFSILVVADDGTCRDYGASGNGARIGELRPCDGWEN